MSALLDAADSVMAESGYESATMSEIAERAGACIGSLYQFFPNKQAVAQGLCVRYSQEIERLWAPLEKEAATLTVQELVSRLMDRLAHVIDAHPALLALMEAPAVTHNPSIREQFRLQIARCLATMRPQLSSAKTMQISIVSLQMMKSFSELYAETKPRQKTMLLKEFKCALACYLTSRLEPCPA